MSQSSIDVTSEFDVQRLSKVIVSHIISLLPTATEIAAR